MARGARGMKNVEASMEMMTVCMKDDGDDDGVHARREVTRGHARCGRLDVLDASCYSLNALARGYD